MTQPNKKVIHIITQMEAGGAQGAAIRGASEFRKRGYDSETWFLYRKAPTYDYHEGVVVLLDKTPTSIVDYLKIFLRLLTKLKKANPRGIIMYTHYANIYGGITGKILKIPYRVASQRNPVSTYPRLARYMDYLIGTLGFYTSNITVSHAVKSSISNYPISYLKRVKTILNGINYSDVQSDIDSIRKKYNLPANAFLLVNVGRLADQKNQLLLIEVLKEFPDLVVAIAGEGPLKKELETEAILKGVKDRFHLLGEVPPNEIASFLKTGNLFLFPSTFEAFGFAMVEAMAVGLPIIANDIPALREILGGNEGEPAGILIKDNDLNTYIEAIKKFQSSPHLMQDYSFRSKKRAANFSLDKMIDGYEACVSDES